MMKNISSLFEWSKSIPLTVGFLIFSGIGSQLSAAPAVSDPNFRKCIEGLSKLYLESLPKSKTSQQPRIVAFDNGTVVIQEGDQIKVISRDKKAWVQPKTGSCSTESGGLYDFGMLLMREIPNQGPEVNKIKSEYCSKIKIVDSNWFTSSATHSPSPTTKNGQK